MPDSTPIAHAEIQEITWQNASWQPVGEPFEIPFNPQSLKVTYSNQKAAEGAGSRSNATQYVGQGTAKLTLDFLFDATVPPRTGEPVDDVRKLTAKVRHFVQPQSPATGDGSALVVPAARFLWGSFKFDGVVDQLDETLTFFSAEGRPLRATVAFALSSAEINLAAEENRTASGAGTTPQTPALSGAPLQQITASAGVGADWKAVATANNIENPRLIPAGTLLDLNPPSASVSASAGASGGART